MTLQTRQPSLASLFVRDCLRVVLAWDVACAVNDAQQALNAQQALVEHLLFGRCRWER